ncbi:MAG: DUF1616 domain-containing protein [Infirmifilum sp.]
MKEEKLWDLIQDKAREKGWLNACLDAYRSWVEGELSLEDPYPPISFGEFLLRPDYSMWLWVYLALITSTLAVIAVSEQYNGFLIPLRYVLGSITVLFLPGYSLIEALYPRREELTPLERLALSIGLSLALVPLIGLVLNYTPFGIRLWPVAFSIGATGISLAFIAAHRKYLYFRLAREGGQHG